MKNLRLCSLTAVLCLLNSLSALCADISIAAAKAIGLSGNPRSGGTEKKIIRYELWPGVPAVVNGVTYNLVPARPA